MGAGLRKIHRAVAQKALSKVRFPVKLSLRQKSDLVLELIREKQARLMLAQEELLTAEALQARKEADGGEAATFQGPQGL